MYDMSAVHILNMAVRTERQRLYALNDGKFRTQNRSVRRNPLRRLAYAFGIQLEAAGMALQDQNRATRNRPGAMQLDIH